MTEVSFKLKCVCCGHIEERVIPAGETEVHCTQCLGPVTVLQVRTRPEKELQNQLFGLLGKRA